MYNCFDIVFTVYGVNIMKMFKRAIVLLAVMSVMLGYSAKSYAVGTAVVDLDKIRENYTVSQELSADLKIKESELQKFVADAQKQIQEAKTPLEKKNLEEKLGEQFNIKRNAYAKDQSQKWGVIEDTVVKSIKEVAASKKFDLVLNKQVVIDGGSDITDEVIKKLNQNENITIFFMKFIKGCKFWFILKSLFILFIGYF